MATLVLAVVADDLSGAAECAAHAVLRVSRSSVLLADSAAPTSAPGPHDHPHPPDDETSTAATVTTVLAVDTDSRRLATDAAVRVVRATAPLVAPAAIVVKKVDSLLRGHLGAEVAVLADELQRVPVVAVANPALGRVVRDGILLVEGTPLHETDLWAVEPGPAPTTVAEALKPLETIVIPRATITRGVDTVAEALADARAAGLVAVCDSETEADLEVVHAAATRVPRSLLVGSGALAAVAARALPDEHTDAYADGTQPRHGALPDADACADGTQPRHGAAPARAVGSLLFVLGTRAPGIDDQLAHLIAARDTHLVLVQPDDLLTDPEAVRRHLVAAKPSRVVAVTLDPAAPADPTRSRALTEGLADVVATVADAYDALFLSGGETARAVLDRLGVDALEVVAEVETGTVVSTRPGGRSVVTRPGSFGAPHSLTRVADHLLGDDSAPGPRTSSPALTVTTQSASAPSSATTKENP
ncbi:four-carbon acid sugar kinase family protein [Terrabacter sp. 2RAF25]|uniref:four-carbon acid sugar kinase family protein n=1 Tax=Terrabacter sp. 2RAF25 TaxID=3232998 RepID=UPI003F96590F